MTNIVLLSSALLCVVGCHSEPSTAQDVEEIHHPEHFDVVNGNESASAALKPVYIVQKEIIDNLFHQYEKSVRPHPKGYGPTIVTVSLFVRRITSIIELAMEFTADVLVRQTWNDPRLIYSVPDGVSLPYVKLSVDAARKLWVPDLFFPSEKQGSYFHTITTPNVMLRVYPNGTVYYGERYSLVSTCDMNLFRYPFDVQRCLLQLGSFSDTTDAIQFVWSAEDSVTVDQNTRMPKYYLGNIQTSPCTNVHATGNFSCLRGEFEFRRQLGFFILESYLPLSLLVVASWLGFWIDASSVPGRVSLSVTTLLTTVAQAANIKHTLPPVSYIKAIDIWLGICVLYVFSALAEFAFVNYLSRREASLKDEKKKKEASCGKQRGKPVALILNDSERVSNQIAKLSFWAKNVDTQSPEPKKQNGDVRGIWLEDEHAEDSCKFLCRDKTQESDFVIKPKKMRWSSKCIDKISRVVFPTSFVIVASFYAYIFIYVFY